MSPISINGLAGQSNAVGGGAVADLSPANALFARMDWRIQIQRQLGCETALPAACQLVKPWEDLGPHSSLSNPTDEAKFMSVELSLGRQLARGRNSGEIFIVHNATSGSSLYADWHPDAVSGQQLYARFLAMLQQAEIDKGGITDNVFWIQANADANSAPDAPNYCANLTYFVERLRGDLGRPDLRLIFDRLSIKTAGANRDIVRAQQELFAATVPNVCMINSDDLELRDVDTHYSANAFIELGLRMGAVANPRLRSPSSIACGIGN